MAYGNSNQSHSGQRQSFSNGGARPQADGPREFKDNPDEVGIAYEKQSESAGTYYSVSMTKDVAAGTKLAIFANNKAKNRTDKTPTHIVKLAKQKA